MSAYCSKNKAILQLGFHCCVHLLAEDYISQLAIEMGEGSNCSNFAASGPEVPKSIFDIGPSTLKRRQ